ncbi:MAG: CHAP domain-containing protein [Bacilli bacterium]
MKKYSILFLFLIILLFSGCTNGPISLQFIQDEIILKLNESSNLPLEYANVRFKDLHFSFSEDGIALIDGEALKAQTIGYTQLTVYTSDYAISSTIDVIVESNVIQKPLLYVPSDYLKLGMQTVILFENEATMGAVYKSFNWELSNDDTITLNDGLITPIALGEVTITATLKSNTNITSSLSIQVSQTSIKKDVNGEIGEGRMIINSSTMDAKIKAGESLQVSIDQAIDMEYYFWKSYQNQVAMAASGGRVIGVAPGIAEIAAFSPITNKIYGTIKVTVYGTPNVDYAQALVDAAMQEEGYVEGYNNDTKYGDWWGIPNGEWCAMFVSWCANEAGITTSIIPKYAACVVGREWFEQRGLFQYKESYQPKKGDIIFFLSSGSSHTGIVTNSNETTVYTIEGNSANRVAQRSYPLLYDTITGYGTPNYPPFTK